jgi:uncharacterized repeat protein (TIGR01451 family)
LTSTADITITKWADVNTAEIGQVVTYTYQVTNSGNITLTNITANDDKLGPVLFTPDTLTPTQAASASLTYTIHVDDLPGPLTNTVTVTGTSSVDPGIQASASASESVDVTSTAELTITKWADVNTAEVGQVVTYTYQVTNSGNITLTNITAYDNKLGVIPFQLSSLDPKQGTVTTLTYTVQITDLPGPLINIGMVAGTAVIQPWQVASATTQETIYLSNEPSISVTKSANVKTVEVGQTITYTYQTTNSGNALLTTISGNDDRLGPISFSPNILEPTQSAIGILTYTVQPTDLPGPLTNTVTVSGITTSEPITSVSASAAETVNLTSTPALGVTKQANVNTAQVGQTITYTYRVTNTGNITLTAITANDDMLGPVPFTPDTLAPTHGTSARLTYTIQLTDLPGHLTNTVTVSGTAAVGLPTLITARATEAVTLQDGQDSPNLGVYLPLILK